MKTKRGGKALWAGAVASLLLVAATARELRAEGGGKRSPADWGANRRVVTNPGFVQVSGTFVMDFDLPVNQIGDVISIRQPRASSFPSFYLGGRSPGSEVDAGLQFDPGRWDQPSRTFKNRGYYVFFNVSNAAHQVTALSWQATPKGLRWESFRVVTGQVYKLTYSVDAGGLIGLDVGGVATFYFTTQAPPDDQAVPPPPDGVQYWPYPSAATPVVSPAAVSNYQVKRNIAMTQLTGLPGVLDGSSLACLFSDGSLVNSRGESASWAPAHTSQGGNDDTGYDTPGGYAWDAYDQRAQYPRVASTALYMVDFPLLVDSTDKRRPGGSTSSVYATQGGVTRYQLETVRINLRVWQYPKGTYITHVRTYVRAK